MPKVKQFADDRSPAIEEIRKLLEFPDPRIKPLVYLMSSSGIRLDALDYLRWKRVVPIYDGDNQSKIITTKLIVIHVNLNSIILLSHLKRILLS